MVFCFYLFFVFFGGGGGIETTSYCQKVIYFTAFPNYFNFITNILIHFIGAAPNHKPCIWYDKNRNVTDVKLYDEASEVCCEMSGTHKKINHQGHEIDCCGGKLCSSISFWFFTVHLFFSVKFTNINNQCNIQYHSVTYRIVIFNKNTYCNINQLFIFYKFISQFPSKR